MATPQVQYEHSGGATIDFYTKDLDIGLEFGKKDVVMKDGSNKVFDSNRVIRVFKFSSVISATDFNTMMVTYMMPASAPDYTTAYPRFTKVYYSNSSYWTNVEVVCVAMRGQYLGNSEKWMCSFTFKEKDD